MGVGDQIGPYCKRMRITQVALAEKIGELPTSLTNWKNGFRINEDQLDKLAEVSGASMDWWRGRPVMSMWGFEIQNLQAILSDEAPSIVATDLVDRCVKVIELAQRHSPLCREEWFMAGVLGLSVPDFHRLMTEKDDLSPVTLGHLVNFTLLHEDWLMDGDIAVLKRRHNLGQYQLLARRFEEDGLQPEEIEANYDSLRRRIYQQRAMLKMPTESE